MRMVSIFALSKCQAGEVFLKSEYGEIIIPVLKNIANYCRKHDKKKPKKGNFI